MRIKDHWCKISIYVHTSSLSLTSYVMSDKSLNLSVLHRHNDFVLCGISERIKLNALVNKTGATWHIAGIQDIFIE